MKKIMLVIGLLLLVSAILAQTAVPPIGNGNEANPYQIATWQNLYWISQNSDSWDKHFVQTEDIEFPQSGDDDIHTWDNGAGWSPIGIFIDYDNPLNIYFTGKYNGNNKIITGLFINRPNTSCLGIFGFTGQGNEITNLGLINVNVTGYEITGGLVGRNYSGVITNCYSSGSVSGEGYKTGGLVGFNEYGNIINCYSAVSVTGYERTGGLVGSNCGAITNCYSTGNIFGGNFSGGLVGENVSGTVINSFYNYELVHINNSYVITTGALTNTLYTLWFPNKSLNIENYLSSDGSNYLINSVNDFKILLAFSQFSYHFKLTSDIDLITEENFLIPYFIGAFNGNGHTISNLSINMDDYSQIGLFGYTNSETEITNLGLINVAITGKDFTGGLVGDNLGSIANCYSSGNVSGSNYVGGLLGFNGDSIENCYSSCNVTGIYSIGGLVGHSSFSTITNCFSTGNASGNELVGGLLGNIFYGSIVNCYSIGSVEGYNQTGGLLGGNTSGDISSSFWDIVVSEQSTSAGGMGLTTEQMKTQSTFTDAGWIFPDVWNINPSINNGYPYLNYPNSVPNDDVTIETPLLTKAVLHSAYPNPFNPSTTISFDLASPETVSINIFNIKGQLIKNICNKTYDKGNHSIIWDGKDNQGDNCGTGVYFYKMTAGKTTQTKKMMMIK